MSSKVGPLDGIRILCTDPEYRIGYFAVRFLAKAGAEVHSIGGDRHGPTPLTFHSRLLTKRFFFSDDDHHASFVQFLGERGSDYDFVNPINVAMMLALMDADEPALRGLKYLLPNPDSLRIADNKELTGLHAEKIEIDYPRTLTRVEPVDIGNAGKRGISFPCVIKFRGEDRRTHWRPEDRYRIVQTPGELISNYQQMHDIEAYPIVQEYIDGPGVGFFALYNDRHQLKAQFCHRRVREYPVSGGPSSCCESIYDKRLVAIGRTLLESLDWKGLAMVEFKYDKRRNRFFLMEINPRYWGSLPLAVFSGVNFPVLHALSGIGREFPPVLEYRQGVRMRFIDKDVKSIISSSRKQKSIVKRIRVLTQLIEPATYEGFLSRDDPWLVWKLLVDRVGRLVR